ncbi:MAG: SDR family oxidoreductase [Pseudomonadales bacterium]
MSKKSQFNRRSTAEQVTEGLDLTGKTVMITGVNSGLGLETLRVMAMRGAHVIGAARTVEKAQQAASSVEGQVTPVACELSDLESVRSCAEQVKALNITVDVLICNAGIMALPEAQCQYGLEMQFLTNHIGHFLLINLLLDTIKKSDAGRIVLLSSMGHMQTPKGGIDFDNLDGSKAYDPWQFYGQSKLANLLTAKALARRLQGSNVTANSVHPGVIRTNLSRNTSGFFSRLISSFAVLFERSIAQGAASQCYVATHKDVASVSGEYFVDCHIAKPSKYGQDEDLAEQLWQKSEELVAKNTGITIE